MASMAGGILYIDLCKPISFGKSCLYPDKSTSHHTLLY